MLFSVAKVLQYVGLCNRSVKECFQNTTSTYDLIPHGYHVCGIFVCEHKRNSAIFRRNKGHTPMPPIILCNAIGIILQSESMHIALQNHAFWLAICCILGCKTMHFAKIGQYYCFRKSIVSKNDVFVTNRKFMAAILQKPAKSCFRPLGKVKKMVAEAAHSHRPLCTR